MSIQDQLQQLLDSVDPADVNDAQLRTITLAHQPDQFDAELIALDSMSCRVTSVRLVTSRWEQSPISELRQIAQRLASRLIYLLEPISPIEIDEDQVVVQLRSSPPHHDDDSTHYYELLVSHSGLRLCRYRQAAGIGRQVIPTELTREILGRLADDFLSR